MSTAVKQRRFVTASHIARLRPTRVDKLRRPEASAHKRPGAREMETASRGTQACACTLTFAQGSRSLCRAAANRQVSSQGERVRSSHSRCEIASAYRKLAEMYWALALGEEP